MVQIADGRELKPLVTGFCGCFPEFATVHDSVRKNVPARQTGAGNTGRTRTPCAVQPYRFAGEQA
ncbi:protein of unknown function [Paraburkholderia dioscoreae]|uniref:Uncharacterized protein n=1 Tax=Paraburkholderia dioscoreae TaxID=2604047 RepID=A0A5Q4ZF07_9BURK|nr:protein of unknown function [Paraburkholderia dioscoreae]